MRLDPPSLTNTGPAYTAFMLFERNDTSPSAGLHGAIEKESGWNREPLRKIVVGKQKQTVADMSLLQKTELPKKKAVRRKTGVVAKGESTQVGFDVPGGVEANTNTTKGVIPQSR